MTAWLKGKLAGSASSPAISRLDRPPFLNSRFQLTTYTYWFATRSPSDRRGRAAHSPSRQLCSRDGHRGGDCCRGVRNGARCGGSNRVPRERGRLRQQPKATGRAARRDAPLPPSRPQRTTVASPASRRPTSFADTMERPRPRRRRRRRGDPGARPRSGPGHLWAPL